MRLACVGVACGHSGRPVLSGIDLTLDAGEILCVLGPNGVGKTTLFRTILGFLPRLAGSIAIDGQDIAAWPRARLARAIAYVPQAHVPPFPFLAGDVVLMGRNPHHGLFAGPGAADRRIADEALQRLGIAALRDRPYTELSGGERQLVLLARALAQQAGLLILDEPTASLDLGNQALVLAQIRRLAADGIGVLMVTHAPDHALLVASRVALVASGTRIACGPPDAVLTRERLRDAYGVDVHLLPLPPMPGAIGEAPPRIGACVAVLPPATPVGPPPAAPPQRTAP